MSRELRIAGYVIAGLLAARVLVLAIDAIALAVMRRDLYQD